MPLIPSSYQPPYKIFRNADVATLYSALLRKVEGVSQIRERLELPDGDFMDLDWSYAQTSSDKCVIAFHGLEGHAGRPYILGIAKIFNQNGFDCCAPNYRDCSGEHNRVFASYHSGKTEDVQSVVKYVLKKGSYSEIVLIGFSLGGNLVLKYSGENKFPKEIKATIAVSTPVDLKGCMYALHSRRNFVYAKDFLYTLKSKLKDKQKNFPDQLSLHEIRRIKTLKEYDDYYTARANGFADAMDYYLKSSSSQYLPEIEIPTLIINAQNDTFLSESCYPVAISEKKNNLFLETPEFGGHVGFVDKNNLYYPERRAWEFVKEVLH